MDIDDDFVEDEITEIEDLPNVSTSPIYVGHPLITVVPDKTKYLPELSQLSRSTLANIDSLKLSTHRGYNSELMKSNLADVDVANIMFLLIPDPASSHSAIYTSPMLAQK